jgi:FAD/FMN-containing dehydrogenase
MDLTHERIRDTGADSTKVKYANARNIPFVALNGGHGAITTLGRVQNGIEIWLRRLDSISIADNGRTATFGGGALSKEVTDTLWAKGKQTG